MCSNVRNVIYLQKEDYQKKIIPSLLTPYILQPTKYPYITYSAREYFIPFQALLYPIHYSIPLYMPASLCGPGTFQRSLQNYAE